MGLGSAFIIDLLILEFDVFSPIYADFFLYKASLQ